MVAKRRSRFAAEENIRRFFADNPESDIITVEDIFKTTGRSDYSRENNIGWLSNIMATLKYYGLATPVYSYDGRKKLAKIKLTEDGKLARKKIQSQAHATNQLLIPVEVDTANEGKVTSDQIFQLVDRFKKQNPQYEVGFTFDLKIKN